MDNFGRPVYTYSYREAVADDWLIDHEPPIRYQTLLSRHGIHFARGEQVETLNPATGELETAELDDDVNFQVDNFNKRVINEDFNRVICDQLAQELDPLGEEKTLIFCATDAHADRVKHLLDTAFQAQYSEQYNEAAVRKITGSVDQVDALIRRYKNERLPSIAITVDLLTTGIDVPAICHLVFMRRVKSRILYEQLKGRATRRCDDIGKAVFKIYDPVDLYATLQSVDTMQPLVKDPNVPLQQLLDELARPESQQLPGSRANTSHAQDVLDQISQRLLRVLRRAQHRAERHPALRARLAELEALWQVLWQAPPLQWPVLLRQMGPLQAAQALARMPQLPAQLADLQQRLVYQPLLSPHPDQLMERVQSWGSHTQPEDYLDDFSRFVREHINRNAALAVVVNAPKDLTREQLKEVRLLLDAHGYSEANLKSAWRNRSQLDIAASIIGFIRQAAVGEALLPFEQRVAAALQRITTQRAWTAVQRKWLGRLARQLTLEVVLDPALVNSAFAQDGGAQQLDKMLGGELAAVMQDLAAYLWPSQA